MTSTRLVDRMRPIVDEAVESLARVAFRVDPIGGAYYSKATSIVSSTYKRHGSILEQAIRTRLADCEYFTVWHEPVSFGASQLVSEKDALTFAEALLFLEVKSGMIGGEEGLK